ncbi:MAG: nuclear transport factor 2 family protein [Chloroflexi bacterium]|nr:nuclear transport factor 2 family protein [Chloroflexota bacterium]
MSEHFDRFMEGWATGNVELLLSACTDDFVFDDAIDGRFTRAEFPAYFESLGEGVLTITDVVTEEIGGLVTAWCWWRLEAPAGTTLVSQEGAALAKVGRDGVHSQRVTYYAREPHIAPR